MSLWQFPQQNVSCDPLIALVQVESIDSDLPTDHNLAEEV